MMGTRLALVLAVVVASASALVAQENPSPAPGSLTIEEVLRLAKSGVSDELIVAEVKKNAKPFDLNSAEIVALKKDGVSETVIKYLLDPTLPYSPAAPISASGSAASAAPSRKFPYDETAEKVPPDLGLYYLSGQKFPALELKSIVPQSQPGKFGKLLGGHVMGAAQGATAMVRVSSETPLVFYARLGGKIMIDDLVLLSFKPSKERRELDFGPKAGTPVFPPKSIYQFDSKEVGPGGLYKLAVPALKEGEYIFFILGSEDDKKGLLGRGYDFGVD